MVVSQLSRFSTVKSNRQPAFPFKEIFMRKSLSFAAALFLSVGLAYAQAPAHPAAHPATSAQPSAAATAPAAPTAKVEAPAPKSVPGNCAAQAVGKNGKPLSGAAKTSFMKKCEGGALAPSDCEAKAVGKNGKPLSGAAKSSFIKKCEANK